MELNLRKPNLIIPGFPKSGTSSLFDYLGEHPDIFYPTLKEPHTYAINERYNRRLSKKGNLNFFNLYSTTELNKCKYVPDASTIYMISEVALKRIKDDNDCNLKLIIIARDPIERIFSHYNWVRMQGVRQGSFKKDILKENDLKFSAEVHTNFVYKNYIEFSKYGKQIQRCYNYIDEENVHIITLEKLQNDFNNSMRNIFHFLDIKPIDIERVVKNRTPKINEIKRKGYGRISKLEHSLNIKGISNSFLFKKKISPISFDEEDEQFIFNFLKEDLKKLSDMNLNFPEWKTVNKYL